MQGAFVDPGGDLERLTDAASARASRSKRSCSPTATSTMPAAPANWPQRLDVPIEGPQREESFWIDQLAAQSRSFGFPPARPFTPTAGWRTAIRHRRQGDTRRAPHAGPHAGHVVFFHAPSKLALVGDVLFAGRSGAPISRAATTRR
jgi:hydroxyacylglutathione hydrolase